MAKSCTDSRRALQKPHNVHMTTRPLEGRLLCISDGLHDLPCGTEARAFSLWRAFGCIWQFKEQSRWIFLINQTCFLQICFKWTKAMHTLLVARAHVKLNKRSAVLSPANFCTPAKEVALGTGKERLVRECHCNILGNIWIRCCPGICLHTGCSKSEDFRKLEKHAVYQKRYWMHLDIFLAAWALVHVYRYPSEFCLNH